MEFLSATDLSDFVTFIQRKKPEKWSGVGGGGGSLIENPEDLQKIEPLDT